MERGPQAGTTTDEADSGADSSALTESDFSDPPTPPDDEDVVLDQVPNRDRLIADAVTFIDVDSMLRRCYGKKKQGVAFGYTKVGGYDVVPAEYCVRAGRRHFRVVASILACSPRILLAHRRW